MKYNENNYEQMSTQNCMICFSVNLWNTVVGWTPGRFIIPLAINQNKTKYTSFLKKKKSKNR